MLFSCKIVSNSIESPMDCSPPGSSVHGISQARILERVATFFSRGSSWPWDQTHISSNSPALQAGSLSLSHLGSPIYIIEANTYYLSRYITRLNLYYPSLRGVLYCSASTLPQLFPLLYYLILNLKLNWFFFFPFVLGVKSWIYLNYREYCRGIFPFILNKRTYFSTKT